MDQVTMMAFREELEILSKEAGARGDARRYRQGLDHAHPWHGEDAHHWGSWGRRRRVAAAAAGRAGQSFADFQKAYRSAPPPAASPIVRRSVGAPPPMRGRQGDAAFAPRSVPLETRAGLRVSSAVLRALRELQKLASGEPSPSRGVSSPERDAGLSRALSSRSGREGGGVRRDVPLQPRGLQACHGSTGSPKVAFASPAAQFATARKVGTHPGRLQHQGPEHPRSREAHRSRYRARHRGRVQEHHFGLILLLLLLRQVCDRLAHQGRFVLEATESHITSPTKKTSNVTYDMAVVYTSFSTVLQMAQRPRCFRYNAS
jgi:hypothetical protein